jgi:hypothetical protein
MRFLIIVLIFISLTSCGFYHYPKVYRKNTIPYDVEVPLHKNIKQNKYNKNNPYYEKDTTETCMED